MQQIKFLACLFSLLFSLFLSAQNDFSQNRIMVAYEVGTTPQERQALRIRYDAILVEYLPKIEVEIWDITNFPVFVSGGLALGNIVEVQRDLIRRAKVDGSGLDYFVDYPENDFHDCTEPFPAFYDPLPCCANANTSCGVGNQAIRIGIIDTGADLPSPQAFYAPYQVDISGFDFVDNDPVPVDGNGHGTQMTSIIGGILDSQTVPSIIISPLKALGDNGTGALSDIVRAVHFAICENMDILNLSFGYVSDKTDAFDRFFENILQQAINQNILILAAAGNQGTCIGENNPYYPASFNLEGMLTIGASVCTAGYTSFSNYGKAVELLSPGELVFCRDTSFGNWVYANGTSHATAIATGMAASIATQQPTFNAMLIIDELLQEQNACVANILDADLNCHPAFTAIVNQTVNSIPPMDSVFTAFDTLTSGTVVPVSNRITFKAGKAIVLKPGFTVPNGSCFTASILECNLAPLVSVNLPVVRSANPELEEVIDTTIVELQQNQPNPFHEATVISYHVPKTAQSAYVAIFSTRGKKVKHIDLVPKGEGQLQLKSDLATGIYFYALYVDGELQVSRKMLVSK